MAMMATEYLTSDGDHVAQLSLSRPEFAEYLGDGARFDSAAEQPVQLFGAGRQLNYLRPLLMELGGRGEAHGNRLGRLRQNLIGLGLRDAFDGQQVLLGGESNRLDGVIAGFLESLHVSRGDSVAL